MHINILQPFNCILIINKRQIKNLLKINYIPITLQIILITEGSLTKNLNCLTNMSTSIKIQQKYIINHNMIKNIRCVWLENELYTKLTFARSLWLITYQDSTLMYKELKNNKPIGQLLIESKKDIHKAIEEIYYGYCQYLEKSFYINQPIWGRKYLLYYKSQTYAIIQEFFSPKILDFFI
uniref:Ycf21 n=1 Tax=Spermothamnion repens TaxID=31383 RepID=A0A4D6X0E8_9FLOR|nr:hypothetical protein [Spermothamnion repens]